MKKIVVILALCASVLVAGTGREAQAETVNAGAIGGAFTLTDQNGKTVSDADFRGKYMMVFFGFTSCESICPTTMLVMTQTLQQLKKDAAKIAPVFITVDPETDTPKQIKEYLKRFHSSFVGLTGKPAQIEDVEKAYKVYAKKAEGKNAGGKVDHSGYVYLMDKDGKFLAVFTAEAGAEVMASKIKDAMVQNH